jgi:hypothetical protein
VTTASKEVFVVPKFAIEHAGIVGEKYLEDLILETFLKVRRTLHYLRAQVRSGDSQLCDEAPRRQQAPDDDNGAALRSLRRSD